MPRHAVHAATGRRDILEVGPLKLAAPPGETLHTGVYDPVTYAYARDGAHAALDVDGCDPFEARFDVRDLAWGADGLAHTAVGGLRAALLPAMRRPTASCG